MLDQKVKGIFGRCRGRCSDGALVQIAMNYLLFSLRGVSGRSGAMKWSTMLKPCVKGHALESTGAAPRYKSGACVFCAREDGRRRAKRKREIKRLLS